MSNDNLIKLLAVAVMTIGIIVIIGWVADIGVLKSLSPTWVTMKFSTAISFLMVGIILYLMNELPKRGSEIAKTLLPVPMIVVLFFMAVFLISNIVGIRTGIEDLFVKEENALKTLTPGRPSIGTVVSFLLIIAASFASLLNVANLNKKLSMISWAVVAIGGLAIVGYVADIPLLYYMAQGFSTAMAIHTAIAFVIVGIGMVLISKSKFIVKALPIKHISIKAKLIRIFLISTVPAIILIGVFDYSYAEQEITQHIFNHLNTIASLQEDRVNEVIERNLERLQGVASRTQLRLSLDSYNEDGNVEHKVKMHQILLDAVDSISDFKDIFILNSSGNVVVSTDETLEDKNYTVEPIFTKGKQEKYISISEDENNNAVLYISGPLMLENKLLGVVVIVSKPDSITTITKDYTGLGETGESFLAKRDENGNALFITSLRFDPDAQLKRTIPNEGIDLPITQALLRHETQFTNTMDYRGEPVLSVTRYIPTADWGLVVKIDKAEAFVPVTNIKHMTTITVIVTAAVVTGVSLYFARSISKPIKKLKDAATQIGQGNYDVKLEVTSDEIGEVAKQFDAMRTNIQETNKNLNRLVELRTEELTIANEKLREQAEKLQEVDKLKEEFSSMITHELKTPLVPIRGYCEMLLDGMYGDLTEKQRAKIQIAYKNVLHLLKMINDILDAHKLELGQMRFDSYDISAKDLIVQCINSFEPLAETKKVSLIDGAEQDFRLVCDPRRILQVLNNLVNNAIKFVPEHEGKIEVSARESNGSVLFIVKDNGIGIPKEKHQNLFKKFYQVDTSLRRKTSGSGLGLAICKGIVEAYGGKIWLESDEGKGSIFYFTIPIGGKDQ